MKKILFLFLLFTALLFGQFSKYKDGFSLETKNILYSSGDTTCLLFAYHSNNHDTILISFNSSEPPKYFYINGWRATLDKNLYFENGFYHIIIREKKVLKHILQQIINEYDIDIISEENSYSFNFSKYKNDIKKSDFYKKIMQ